ncbi:hypothetical protein [Phenylobacterium kunshanense]|uniref:hypothetical protein n=1 Tax=Phenylobacterium kunshanense TaxID=1445034 RepID=UPI001057E4C5|nr:hypothetical protein [Phenylobacterium kunshanense]
MLRHSGATQARACAELGVSSGRGQVLEALLRVARPGAGCDSERPRFARHDRHVAAVQAQGGYPVLSR